MCLQAWEGKSSICQIWCSVVIIHTVKILKDDYSRKSSSSVFCLGRTKSDAVYKSVRLVGLYEAWRYENKNCNLFKLQSYAFHRTHHCMVYEKHQLSTQKPLTLFMMNLNLETPRMENTAYQYPWFEAVTEEWPPFWGKLDIASNCPIHLSNSLITRRDAFACKNLLHIWI